MSKTAVALIPAGPFTNNDFLKDTVDSIFYYASIPTSIVIIDDAHNGGPQQVAAAFQRVEVVPTICPPGKRGHLYVNTAHAIDYVLRNYACDVIIKTDDDGLVTGRGGELEALAFFAAHPDVAIAGSYDVDCMGQPRSFVHAARRLRYLATVGRIVLPAVSRDIRMLLDLARSNGYVMGEHCLGGISIWNAELFRRISARGLLVRPALAASGLQEDHIFGLIARAAGYRLADLATGEQPFAVAWRGLPCAPDELVAGGKKFAHSTRSWGEMDEAAVRAVFRAARAAAASATPADTLPAA